MSDKIFCGQGKEKKFDNGGSIISISVCVSDLPKDKIKESKNGKKYINLKVCQKKQVDDYGNSHYVEVDMWEPTQQNGPSNNGPSNSDIPF